MFEDPTARFFHGDGNRYLCVAPINPALRRLGALCFARGPEEDFSKDEIGLISLIADYVALAIDDRLNFADSEAARVQLESERRKKLRVILDLNDSVVSNLELREVLRCVSPSIRKTMRLDGVALILPAETNGHLQLYALDFPDGKGNLNQDMSKPLDDLLASRVFRTGKPWIGDIEELNRSGFANSLLSEDGVETICMLPLVRCNRILGVLCLVRLEKNAFTAPDIEFLSQITGQVAIAIDNAFAYRRITEASLTSSSRRPLHKDRRPADGL